MSSRKLVLYISQSIDGFIATNDDDLSWLSIVEVEGEDYGYHSFTQSIDTYIIGRKTYDWVVKEVGHFPQSKQFDCYVITRQELPPQEGITFYTGNIQDLITQLKQAPGKNIYCDGGGEIVRLLMEHDLIDEYIVSIIPIFLGDGKRLFRGGIAGIQVEAQPAKYYPSGLVQLRYTRKEPS